MLRDTLSTNVLHAGVKFNVIPGEAVLEIDCRRLPGTTEPEMEARIRERLGPELAAVTDIELIIAHRRGRRRRTTTRTASTRSSRR